LSGPSSRVDGIGLVAIITGQPECCNSEEKKGAGSSVGRKLTNEVTALKVEAIELVTGLFGIHDLFKNYEGGALGVIGDSLAYLA
jgi:hypothetical protein